jgi:starch phosphorylase
VDWIKWMKNAIATILPKFSAARMVREYAEEAYMPAAERGGTVTTSAPSEAVW